MNIAIKYSNDPNPQYIYIVERERERWNKNNKQILTASLGRESV